VSIIYLAAKMWDIKNRGDVKSQMPMPHKWSVVQQIVFTGKCYFMGAIHADFC
jgi:hypothetical protein